MKSLDVLLQNLPKNGDELDEQIAQKIAELSVLRALKRAALQRDKSLKKKPPGK
jgi:hypothetical protein